MSSGIRVFCSAKTGTLTCVDADGNPVEPSSTALAAFLRKRAAAAGGAAQLDAPVVFELPVYDTAARLEICDTCVHRSGSTCGAVQCGCSLASMAAAYSNCPKGLWPVVPAPAQRTVDTPQSEEGPK